MSMRLDKYVWSVRLVKTRSQASELVKKGKVKLNQAEAKSSKEVKVGDLIQLHKATAVFEYKVLDFPKSRVGAKLVATYITDLTLPEELEKYTTHQVAQQAYRTHGTGKPSKKDRRSIDDFLSWD